MLCVGAMVVFVVAKEALSRATEHPAVVGVKGVSPAEALLGIAVLLRILERIGEAALGHRARQS